jgi:hypothetical protein
LRKVIRPATIYLCRFARIGPRGTAAHHPLEFTSDGVSKHQKSRPNGLSNQGKLGHDFRVHRHCPIFLIGETLPSHLFFLRSIAKVD